MNDSLLRYIEERIARYNDPVNVKALGRAYVSGAMWELTALKSLLTSKFIQSEESVPDATGDSTNGICIPYRPKDPSFEGTDNH